MDRNKLWLVRVLSLMSVFLFTYRRDQVKVRSVLFWAAIPGCHAVAQKALYRTSIIVVHQLLWKSCSA